MISTMKFREFGSRAEASEALAETIAHALGAALDSGGRASFVASGGGSPRETYERLGRSAIDWRRVSVIPSDERLVPVGSSRHNLSMIRKTLGTEAAFVELTLQTDIDTLRPFDAALFGMGDDGHTASLFPDDPEIDAALRSRGNTHEAHVPRMPEARISLTPCALANAGTRCLLIFGAKKREVLAAACEPCPASAYPVTVLLEGASAELQVFWAA